MCLRRITMVISERRAFEKFGWRRGSETRPPMAEYDVDLDALSPVARLMAGRIETTNNMDERSVIWIRQVPTRRQLDERHGVLLSGHHGDPDPGPHVSRVDRWHWSRPLRHEETPEAWFERQAGEMLRAGFVLEELDDSWAWQPCGAGREES